MAVGGEECKLELTLVHYTLLVTSCKCLNSPEQNGYSLMCQLEG